MTPVSTPTPTPANRQRTSSEPRIFPSLRPSRLMGDREEIDRLPQIQFQFHIIRTAQHSAQSLSIALRHSQVTKALYQCPRTPAPVKGSPSRHLHIHIHIHTSLELPTININPQSLSPRPLLPCIIFPETQTLINYPTFHPERISYSIRSGNALNSRLMC